MTAWVPGILQMHGRQGRNGETRRFIVVVALSFMLAMRPPSLKAEKADTYCPFVVTAPYTQPFLLLAYTYANDYRIEEML